jgi:pimeloyl-ACP methyl ester carboxylesterase
MGISNDAMAWPPEFIESLTNAGYRVIRYDYRGSGLSDWLDDYTIENAYDLSDMSDDIVSILYALNINKAHFLGVSMGGMVSQQTALDHPEKVQSLISVMSSGYITDPELPELDMDIITKFVILYFKYGMFASERKQIKYQLAGRYLLMGDSAYALNIREVAQLTLYNLRNRNGYNPKVSRQHNQAVFLSGSRYEGLKHLHIPVLVIHGNSDPFVPLEHGKKYADLIPNAETFWVEGMGHDIPDRFNDELVGKIISFVDKFPAP